MHAHVLQVEVIFDDDIEEEALLNQVMDEHDNIILEHGPVDGLEVWPHAEGPPLYSCT